MSAESTAKKTQGELEAEACNIINRLHRDLTGRGPRSISASLQGKTLVVVLEGVLTRTEETLLNSSTNADEGGAVVQAMRKQLVQHARAALVAALKKTFGQQPTGILHDIAPEVDEEAFVFRFSEDPKPFQRRA